jgi:hypothetical protein
LRARPSVAVHQVSPGAHVADHVQQRLVGRFVPHVERLMKLCGVELTATQQDLACGPGIVA